MLPISNSPHKEAELNLQLAANEWIHEGPQSYGVTAISNLSPVLFSLPLPPPFCEAGNGIKAATVLQIL